MPRPSIDPGFNRPMPSPEPVMNGDDGVFGDRPKYTQPWMPSPKDDSRAHYEPWIEQGISYEEYMRRMNGGMFKPAPDQRQPMPNTDPNMPWIPGTDQPNYRYYPQPMPSQNPNQGLYDRIKQLMPTPQPVKDDFANDPWNAPGGIAASRGEEYLKQNPYLGPSLGAPSSPIIRQPAQSQQPSIPRQPRISQESFNNKPISSWM